MLTQHELISEFNKGNLEVVRKECFRYGQIILDNNNESEGMFYRYSHIEHFGNLWDIEMENGSVISINFFPI